MLSLLTHKMSENSSIFNYAQKAFIFTGLGFAFVLCGILQFAIAFLYLIASLANDTFYWLEIFGWFLGGLPFELFGVFLLKKQMKELK